MVGSGQPSIREIRFESRVHPSLPVEVIDRSELMSRHDPKEFATPQRPSFHAFLLVQSGTGIHMVDFVEISVRPGQLVQVRPGQVQIWDIDCAFEAVIVLSKTSVPPLSTHSIFSNAHRDLDQASLRTAQGLVELLRREQERFDGNDASIRLMNALFEALCCVFERGGDEQPTSLPKPYVAFVEAVEDNLFQSHTVRELADSIGFSERTITRACQKVCARSAREVLNERLVVEAKRLLAYTDRLASEIATDLGFSEPTNFHKFFIRHAGMRPSQFRSGYRKAS